MAETDSKRAARQKRYITKNANSGRARRTIWVNTAVDKKPPQNATYCAQNMPGGHIAFVPHVTGQLYIVALLDANNVDGIEHFLQSGFVPRLYKTDTWHVEWEKVAP